MPLERGVDTPKDPAPAPFPRNCNALVELADELTPQIRAFLEEGTRTAKLATLTVRGWPHVMAVWFVLDEDELVFSTGRDTVKGRYLRRDKRVSVCVDDERPPFAYAAW
jgi:hypothetical protein